MVVIIKQPQTHIEYYRLLKHIDYCVGNYPILIFSSQLPILIFRNMVRCFNLLIYWSLGLSKCVEKAKKVLKHGILNDIRNSRNSRNNESTLTSLNLENFEWCTTQNAYFSRSRNSSRVGGQVQNRTYLGYRQVPLKTLKPNSSLLK